jgi:methylmalonyl-CoA mutase N-terminal domain/subunit
VEEAEKQIARLEKVRAERDADAVASTLERVREAAASGENVMPSIMDAVEVYATGGEVCSTLESVFGRYRESVSF